MRKQNNFIKIVSIILVMIIALASLPFVCVAASEKQQYNIGNFEKTDKEYVPKGSVDKKDPHSGWSLGNFCISGYTRVAKDEEGNPVFLKNAGDEVTLSFNLAQDINKLNGDETKCIASITDGYDKNYDYSEAVFGQGLLIVKQTDSNNQEKTNYYKNYLKGVQSGANTKINLNEEGTYEVSLDYCVADGKAVFGLSKLGKHKIVPSYDYYRIHFKFTVGNGNCTIFVFDLNTKSELSDGSYTENGFRLDLANSKELNIDVKKEVFNNDKDGLVKDTRFNKPASDGAEFTDEGVYTITVTNHFTKQETTKTIYVGTDKTLKAYTKYNKTGLSIVEINNLVKQGATISDDGTIDSQTTPVIAPEENVPQNNNEPEKTTALNSSDDTDTKSGNKTLVIILIVIIVALILFFAFKLKQRKAHD